MLPDTLTEDDQVALTRLATLLAGDAGAGRRLLARSAVRPPDQDDLVDAADYPYESSRRQLIGTFISRRGSGSSRSRGDRIRHAVAVLSHAEELGPESVARVTGLSATRVAAELDAAPSAAEWARTRAPLLEAVPESIALDDEIDRQARLQRRGRRRTALLAGVAALVLAAAIAVPSVIIPRLPREPHDPDSWAMVHTVEPQEGWSVVSRGITPTMEMTAVSEGEDSPSEACYVRLFAPRLGPLDLGFDPGNPPGEEFRLDGRPGWFAESPSEQEPPTVFWLYADEAWATFFCLDGPDTERDDLARLARSVSFEPQQVDVPVRFSRLADGHRIEGVTMLGEQTIVALATGGQNAWTVVIATADTDQGASRDDSVRVGDRMARYNSEGQELCLTSDEPVTLCLGAHWNGTAPTEDQPDPRSELVRIAEGLEPAPDLSDRSTWFDARDAFP